jgi:AbrB family looped-hinge helix DNA binding protein
MRTTIDAAGRIVVPKALRDELGLQGGEELEIAAVDGNLEIGVRPTPIRLVRRDGVLVAEPVEGKLPPLTPEQVRETLERVRR